MTEVVATGRPRSTGILAGLGVTRALALGFVLVCLAVAVAVPFLPLGEPNRQHLGDTLASYSAEHLLGTDQLGRDLLARLLWGTRTSLFAALTAIAVATAVGLPFGMLAGYRRGWVEAATGRVADVILTVPALVLLLTVHAALRSGITGQMVTLGVVFAPRIYRVVRTETVKVATLPYLMAGRMSGCSHTRILLRYLLPGIRAQSLVQVSYLLGLSLLIEAGISFLGVGVESPNASLGTMLSGAAAMLASAPRVVLIPAAVLSLLILSLNVIGDIESKGERRG
ncbi:ABC transporter permease [Microtetraspora niveoalba]|uniref:ABC transporter permease n=1 Tax=Microtetraspora niveoalba TaxID=46175 RepID=UPI00082E6E07|nr:ABC transporter permease [Microtetraspora niveoalba]